MRTSPLTTLPNTKTSAVPLVLTSSPTLEPVSTNTVWAFRPRTSPPTSVLVACRKASVPTVTSSRTVELTSVHDAPVGTLTERTFALVITPVHVTLLLAAAGDATTSSAQSADASTRSFLINPPVVRFRVPHGPGSGRRRSSGASLPSRDQRLTIRRLPRGGTALTSEESFLPEPGLCAAHSLLEPDARLPSQQVAGPPVGVRGVPRDEHDRGAADDGCAPGHARYALVARGGDRRPPAWGGGGPPPSPHPPRVGEE